MADDRPQLGAGIIALHDPHRGHEHDFNVWYEADHMLAAGTMAPWTIAGARWVAPRALRDLRYPADGPFGPSDRGAYLMLFWIQAGRLADQQAWVFDEMQKIAEQDRNFARARRRHRDHVRLRAQRGARRRRRSGGARAAAPLPGRGAGGRGAHTRHVARRARRLAAGRLLRRPHAGLAAPDGGGVHAAPEGAVVAGGRARGGGRRRPAVRRLLHRDRPEPTCGTSTSPASARRSAPPASAACCSPPRSSLPSSAPTPTPTPSGDVRISARL